MGEGRAGMEWEGEPSRVFDNDYERRNNPEWDSHLS